MPGFRDLREFIEAVSATGELRTIRGADANLEVGAITEAAAQLDWVPMLLFEGIEGCSGEYRVLTNFLKSPARENMVYGVDGGMDDLTAMRHWKDRCRKVTPIPPRLVADGPVKTRVLRDDEVDLEPLPFVKWHAGDGGRYLCGTSVIMRDPDDGYVNIGSYRFMLIDRQTMVFHIGSGHNGDVIRKKYWARGQPCPLAISLGQEPGLFVAAGTNLRYGSGEYEYAGWMRGEPVDVVEGEATGLPVPAHAEVVLEGTILPPEEGERNEGPFGEASGYYGGGAHPSSLVVVRAILRRDDPIVLARPPASGGSRERLGSRAIQIWNELEDLGIPNVTAVNYDWGFTVIAIKQMFPGHAMRAAHGALGGTAGYHAKFVIVVDDDVDIFNPRELLWVLATRCDPETSLDVARRIWTYRIDPRLSPEKRAAGEYTGSAAILDACRPFHWRDRFPAVSAMDADLRRSTMEKWGSALR